MTLPSSPSGVKPYSVRWLSGRGRGSIALVSGGVLQIWRVQMRAATGKGKSSNTASITKKKTVEFGLAPISDSALPLSITEQLFPQPGDPEPTQDCYGDWLPRSLPSRKPVTSSLAPLSFSEIETNPPYQPFYTDKRVARFVYSRQPLEIHEESSEYHRQNRLIQEAWGARRVPVVISRRRSSGSGRLFVTLIFLNIRSARPSTGRSSSSPTAPSTAC